MSIVIVYEIDCHCGGTATTTCLATDQPEEDGRIHIDIEMAATQQTFECPKCHCTIYTGDLEAQNDDDDCDGPDCTGCGMPEDGCACVDSINPEG